MAKEKDITRNVDKMGSDELVEFCKELQARIHMLVKNRAQSPLEKIGCRAYLMRGLYSEGQLAEYCREENEFYRQKAPRMVVDDKGWWESKAKQYLKEWYREPNPAEPKELLKRCGTSLSFMYGAFEQYCLPDILDQMNPAVTSWIPPRHIFTQFVHTHTKLGKDKGVSLYTFTRSGGKVQSRQCLFGIFPTKELISMDFHFDD